ncbi:MAG: hypothetical protein PHE50_09240 [Dehalococcoidales bacterium]|nr:hypothetical protein [Dehalococcoidales bacterium]
MKKIFTLLLTALFLLTIGLTGCANVPTTKALTANEVAAKVVSGYPNITTMTLDMTMDMILEVTGGQEPGKMTTNTEGVFLFDIAKKLIKADMSLAMDVPGQGKNTMDIVTYVKDEWMYIGVNGVGTGTQWGKQKLTTDIWKAQNQLAQQVAFLEKAVKVTITGSETINGADCYVLEVVPDTKAIQDWILSQQQETLSQMGNVDLSKVIKTMSVKEWINKKNFYPMKADISATMGFVPADVQAEAADFNTMTMTMTASATYKDYGETVVVDVPAEALSASEITQ